MPLSLACVYGQIKVHQFSFLLGSFSSLGNLYIDILLCVRRPIKKLKRFTSEVSYFNRQ